VTTDVMKVVAQAYMNRELTTTDTKREGGALTSRSLLLPSCFPDSTH